MVEPRHYKPEFLTFFANKFLRKRRDELPIPSSGFNPRSQAANLLILINNLELNIVTLNGIQHCSLLN